MNKKKIAPVKKYDVDRSKKLGRYLVAAKDLSPGEVILRERAAGVGPSSIYESSQLVYCFECMRPLNHVSVTCSRCEVAPLCNRGCEGPGRLHSDAECRLFQDRPEVYRDNLQELIRVLLHLRLWLLKDTGDSWDRVWGLEAHLEQRRNTEVWQDRENTVVDVFRKFGLHEVESEKDESLQRLCGIIDVNTFELRPPGGPSSASPLLRGLFPEASLMAHACRPSAHVAVDEDFCMAVHAAVPLKAGDIISFNYTSSLLGTIERQEHLKEGKYFRCECEVCKDPLEGGSHLSSIVCPRCRKDFVAIQKPTSPDPYGAKTKWQCQKCKRIYRGCLVKTTVELAKSLVMDVDNGNLKALEALLDKFYNTFHKNHFVMLSLKHKILAVCRQEVAKVNPQRKVLQRMLDVCREILELLEIVEPGISRLKGIVLYEMQLPMSLLASRAYAAREIDETELLGRLVETQAYLKRALSILLLEPVNTPEGLLAKRALIEMKVIAQNIEDVKAMPIKELPQGPRDNHRNKRKIKAR